MPVTALQLYATAYISICHHTLLSKVVAAPTIYICAPKKADIVLPGGSPPQSYGTSLAISDHIGLPATRHMWTLKFFLLRPR